LNVVDEKITTEEIVQFPMDVSDSFGDTVLLIRDIRYLRYCTISAKIFKSLHQICRVYKLVSRHRYGPFVSKSKLIEMKMRAGEMFSDI